MVRNRGGGSIIALKRLSAGKFANNPGAARLFISDKSAQSTGRKSISNLETQ